MPERADGADRVKPRSASSQSSSGKAGGGQDGKRKTPRRPTGDGSGRSKRSTAPASRTAGGAKRNAKAAKPRRKPARRKEPAPAASVATVQRATVPATGPRPR
jgi:hypothetical protein